MRPITAYPQRGCGEKNNRWNGEAQKKKPATIAPVAHARDKAGQKGHEQPRGQKGDLPKHELQDLQRPQGAGRRAARALEGKGDPAVL